MNTYQQSLNKNIDEQEIYINDFGKYHRFRITDTETSETKIIKELNNSRYEEFFQNYLKPFSTNDKITSLDANLLWYIFEDTREIFGYEKNRNYLPKSNKDLVDFWMKEFEKPIEELYMYGTNAIARALSVVVEYYREWFHNQKFERIYSKGNSIQEWFKLAKENKDLMEGIENPYSGSYSSGTYTLSMEDFANKARVVIGLRT